MLQLVEGRHSQQLEYSLRKLAETAEHHNVAITRFLKMWMKKLLVQVKRRNSMRIENQR